MVSGGEMVVEKLTADQLKELLTSLNLNQYQNLIASNEITAEFLSLCENAEDVRELGIKNSVHARALFNAVKKLDSSKYNLYHT